MSDEPDQPVFSARAARDEDLIAAAADYEDWLDQVHDQTPDPQPEDFHPARSRP